MTDDPTVQRAYLSRARLADSENWLTRLRKYVLTSILRQSAARLVQVRIGVAVLPAPDECSIETWAKCGYLE